MRTFTAALSFSGSAQKSTTRNLTAALSFTGAIQKQTGRTLSASASFVGSIGRRITRALGAGLPFVGGFIAQYMPSYKGPPPPRMCDPTEATPASYSSFATVKQCSP